MVIMPYVLKRLLMMLPTLAIIIVINFFIVQIAPGGPLEQQLTKIQAEQQALFAQGFQLAGVNYQGASGLSPDMLSELNARFGFDLPVLERFWLMISQLVRFDLGDSFFQGQSVLGLIADKLPTTMLLGSLSLLVMYSFGIAIGAYKARQHGSYADMISTILLSLLHALPVFVLAVLLLLIFAGGSLWQIFPLQGLTSPDFEQLSLFNRIKDLLWHLTLPVIASSMGSIAGIAYLTKFGVLNEMHQPYVMAMQAEGVPKSRLIYTQVLKNSLLPVASSLPLSIIGVLFSGNFLIEVVFGIDGVGRLAFDAVMQRDYPLMFGILYIFTLIGMIVQLLFDLLYQYLDPRVDFGYDNAR